MLSCYNKKKKKVTSDAIFRKRIQLFKNFSAATQIEFPASKFLLYTI